MPSVFSFLLSFSLLLSTSNIDDSAAAAMRFIESDVSTVVNFAVDWAMQAGMAATSTLAFIVVAKRFVD
jgi:hypothetical protein